MAECKEFFLLNGAPCAREDHDDDVHVSADGAVWSAEAEPAIQPGE